MNAEGYDAWGLPNECKFCGERSYNGNELRRNFGCKTKFWYKDKKWIQHNICKQNKINMKCFHCDGEYEKVVQDYKGEFGNKGKIYGSFHVPDIEILTCNKCGDECIDNENSKKIDEVAEMKRKQVEIIMAAAKIRREEY